MMHDDQLTTNNTSPFSTQSFPTYLRSRPIPDVPQDIDFIEEHLNDPNFDLKGLPPSPSTGKSWEFQLDNKETLENESQIGLVPTSSRQSSGIEFDDESPYPEVRASVASTDDPMMPVNTFRMWFLGILFSIVIPGLNQFFSSRYPTVHITGIVGQLIALPLGKGLEYILPKTRFRTFGYTWSLNPGPFNIKEHVCITVMGNISVTGAYATEILATQRIFYNQITPFVYQITLTLGSQIIGFSLGGLLRQFIVWPSSMIWPGALVNCALFNTLHKNYGKRDRGHMTREKFFCIVMGFSFVWYWVPGYFFVALSVFNWVCWIAPNNTTINALFGTQTGLGLSLLTLDWSMISFISSPLVTPWWAELNAIGAVAVIFWIIAPIVYFTNTFFTAHLPISGVQSFDNTGAIYNASAVVVDGIFDAEKYRQYSPVFMPATFAMAYARDFALFPAVIIHTLLWFRRDIAKRFRSSLRNERDIHSRLMQAYSEVPAWWYAAVGILAFISLLVSIEIFPTQLPIWAACVAFGLAVLLSIPLGMLQAITNQQVQVQVMHELIVGYMLPGKPVANTIFKAVALMGTNQAVAFSGDLKLGHYMKIPPRMMFSIQLVSALISCFVVLAVQNWMFAHIEDLCMPGQKDNFTCPGTNAFATASLLWGGIGPKRMFTEGVYSPLLYFFAIGALLPIPFFFLARRFPLSFWRYVNIPVALAGASIMPPASGHNYAAWAITGFIFNYFIRRYHFRWWMRYNYILSAGLDAGVALAVIIIFFGLQFPNGGINLDWWGNTIFQRTADAKGVPILQVEDGSIFGPLEWH